MVPKWPRPHPQPAGGGDSGESDLVGDYTRRTHVHRLADAGEPKCVRRMNHVYARACVREKGRQRERRKETSVRDTLRSRCNPGDTGWEDTDLGIPMRHSKGVARLPGQLSRLIRLLN